MRRSDDVLSVSRRGLLLALGTGPFIALAAPLHARGRTVIGQPGDLDQLWICTDIDCSPHIYDPREGDPVGGVPAGTPMEAVPDDWACPECGAPKSAFVRYRRRA